VVTGIDFSTLTFGEPLYLWVLLAPAALLALWMWQVLQRRRDARRSKRDRLLPVRERLTPVGDLAFWFCLLLAASMCIVALARPEARVTLIRKAGADVVILQDGSASMYVKDVNPDRWRRSIQFLRALGDSLAWKGDRVALALFARRAAPQVRLTKDPNAFFFFIDHLGAHSPFRLQDNPTWDTNIETGIEWGLKLVAEDERLFGKSKNPKGFVVITDGQAWSGDVAIALRAARARQIPVDVVGVGTGPGGMIPEAPGPDGVTPPSTIRAVLDRASLRQIAAEGGGQYFELGRESDRDIAFRIVGRIKSRAVASIEAQPDESVEELYWQFLFAAAILLCLGAFVLKEGTELWWQVAGAVATVLLLTDALR
jgi:Ca-activated chloride channel family protein